MKIVYKNLKEGKIKLIPEGMEDLWHLYHIITPGDYVEGKTIRAVDFGKSQEKKPVFLKIQVEKVEFAKYSNVLRITGKIIEGKPEEFVQLGRYHTFNLKPRDAIAIIKKKWKKYELERIEEAIKESGRSLVRVLLVDEEKALIAEIKPYGFEILAELKSGISKRAGEEKKERFYEELLKYVDGVCIIAGPGFEKENFFKYAKEKGKKNIYMASVSYAELSGLKELVEKGIIDEVIGEIRLAKEAKVMEEIMRRIGKDSELIAYGKEEVKLAAEMHAIETLAVADDLVREKEVEEIMESVNKTGGRVVVFSSQSQWGAQLKGFGGIVALLRFPIGNPK